MKEWELYKFPGGKVGEVKSRAAVMLWLLLNFFTLRECRAINRITGEHIVR